MDVDDPLLRTATEVDALLRDRAVSSRELTEAALRRIERLDPLVNAVVVTCPDEALAGADRADAALAAGAAGALLGLPITIKEAIDAAALPTTWGNPAFAGHVVTSDATVVTRCATRARSSSARPTLTRCSGTSGKRSTTSTA
jgi:amidase